MTWEKHAITRRDRRVPTKGTVEKLAQRCELALEAIVRTIVGQPVSVPDATSDCCGWGQYLDDEHRSDSQWGRYGTSAALRVLGARDRLQEELGGAAPDHPRPRVHPDLVPADVPHSTFKASDFDRTIKLAYILEGLEPHRVKVEKVPALVGHAITLRANGEAGWTSRDPGVAQARDRRLASAAMLFALRRFPSVQNGEQVRDAYRWLAGEVLSHDVQIDLLALAGNALADARTDLEVIDRDRALSEIDRRLLRWIKSEKTVAVDRPFFNGFPEYDSQSDRERTDYIFLSPEILAARYLLRRPQRKARRFVLKVMAALTSNIEANLRGDRSALRIQGTMMRTVDQGWAADLLAEFALKTKDRPGDFAPRLTDFIGSHKLLFALYGLVVAATCVVVVLTHQPATVVLGLVAGVLLTLATSRKKTG